MIDENCNRIPIWLLWGRSKNNLVTLVAVTLTQQRAMAYRKMLLSRFVHVQIEKTEANHLYVPNLESTGNDVYGDVFLQKERKTAVELVSADRDKLKAAYTKLLRAVFIALKSRDFGAIEECLRELQQNDMIAAYM